MIDEKLINRINELAKIAKERTLTEAESVERKQLRQQYLDTFRAGMKQTIEATKIYDEAGQDVTPEKLKEVQREKGLRDQ